MELRISIYHIITLPLLYLTFLNDVEEHEFPSYCTKSYLRLGLYQIVPQTWGKIFLYSHLSFTAAYSLKLGKDRPVDSAKL